MEEVQVPLRLQDDAHLHKKRTQSVGERKADEPHKSVIADRRMNAERLRADLGL
jgi:hypothetical protein